MLVRHPSLVLCLALVLILSGCAETWSQSLPDSVAGLVDVRNEFVRVMEREREPEELTANALISAGRMWAIAAGHLTETYLSRDAAADFDQLKKQLLSDVATTRKVDQRQIIGLTLLYHSIRVAAQALALGRQDRETYREIDAIDSRLQDNLNPKLGYGHALVNLSSGVMSMLALAIRSVDIHRAFLGSVNRELAERLAHARAIGRRDDIHNRGKLFLLSLNNFEGCFALVYLFNLAVDKQLADEVDPIKTALEHHQSEKPPPAAALALTLTALADTSFPLTMRLIQR